MFITKKHLPRRTFLRGVGATLALPLLDAMVPARTLLAKTAGTPASRLGFVYLPHGANMDKWTPLTEGAGFELSPTLKPLEAFRKHLDVVSGLGHGLDEAAVQAAQQIKFKPAKRDGQPVDFPARVRIEFRLAY